MQTQASTVHTQVLKKDSVTVGDANTQKFLRLDVTIHIWNLSLEWSKSKELTSGVQFFPLMSSAKILMASALPPQTSTSSAAMQLKLTTSPVSAVSSCWLDLDARG